MIAIYNSPSKARSLGCTHRARVFGIVPGYFDIDRHLWVPLSDLLNPVEDLLSFIWVTMRRLRNEEPDAGSSPRVAGNG